MKCKLCKKKFEGDQAWAVHRGHHKTGYIKEDGSRNWEYSERSMRLVDRRKAMRIARLETLLKLAKMS